jgi:hypothetical protein
MTLEIETPGAAGTASGGRIVGLESSTLPYTASGTTITSRFARSWLMANYGIRPKVVAVILEASGLGGDA